ncbi:methylase [Trypanosoma conorhini]|uniref:Methylase n=1 Tax=Trypanosoma conorhini TaxID=83891 RepID=A0A422Q9G4_9TRYP|nr:methylase [Trypanosoma conorhini]RNF26590.1 methylase [Trypanosoma conorhini]
MATEKPYYESCAYNSEPIGDVLEQLLRTKRICCPVDVCTSSSSSGGKSSPCAGGVSVLEVAAGTGQHAVYMTQRFPPPLITRWVCTDLPEMLPGICRWLQEDGKDHPALVKRPYALSFTDMEARWLEIRALATEFPHLGYDLVFTANSFHIAPWRACRTLIQRLPLVVRPGGMFIVYGAFNYNGAYTSESNRRFDAQLKQCDPERGIREKEAVESLLAQVDFKLEEDYAMPENNRCLCFRRHTRAH